MDESKMEQETITQPVSPVKGLIIVVAVAVVVAIYLAITHSMGISEFWAGFLWLFYWAGVEQMSFDRIDDSIIGSTAGLLTAFLLHAFPQILGTTGLILALGLVVVLVYCLVMGWAKKLVNNATMLFLTVGTIPHLQANGDFPRMFSALIVGIIFFGGLLWLGGLVGKKHSK
ncbi:MAG: hypothetical protein KJ882_05745 [Proteobacteria bacterium]|nr:hypothetical protein [Pseudomonadota bacterium]MBU4010251.1 hypothetical protein [Pseudomonadota bacterium]MBU4035745.1 hypothetical protein [Pseudomonadota bacterium]